MQIVSGYISKTLKEKITSSKKILSIIGSFSSGTYLENDFIFAVCDDSYGFIPFGISIPNYKETIYKMNLEENYHVILTKQYLQLINENQSVQINFVERDYCPGNVLESISNKEFVEVAINELAKVEKGTFGKFFVKQRDDNIYYDHLMRYLNNDDGIIKNKNINELLANLIGLGPGLTPSGDDFLVGYLYQRIHDNSDSKLCIQEIENYIKENSKRLTNTFSNLYYEYVLNKERFSLYDNVCFAKDKNFLQQAIQELFKMGSNSGADFLTGVLFARLER